MGRVSTYLNLKKMNSEQLTQGQGMCKNIVEKANLDQPLLLYNRSTQRSVELSQKLPTGKSEVVEAVEDGVPKSDIIFICLANDHAVESVLDQILKTSVAGKLIIDCSTIHPDTTTKISKAIVGAGAEFVAAPVFGAAAMAESGQLIGVLAGPKSSVDKARPYFKGVMAKAEIDMADEPYSKSTTLKLVGNTFILNMVEQLAEGHVLAEKSGLGTKYLHSWIEQMFPGPYTAYSTRMISGDYYTTEEPKFAVDLAKKDAVHALRLAKASGTRMQNVETAMAHLDAVKEHAGPTGDMVAIYGAVRKEAGLKYENNA